MSEIYAQCRMRLNNVETVGYIPARAAKVGNEVELFDKDGSSQFWKVLSVGTTRTKEQVKEAERGYKDFQGSTRGGGIDE